MINFKLLTILILGLSISIQILTAFRAVKLIEITGKRTAWSFIAVALVLMALRRIVPFFRSIIEFNNYTPDIINETIALIISICMAFGIWRIKPLFIERKRIENELRTKTLELDQYFTNALDLLCIADTDGFFRRLNPEWEITLGYPVSELIGKQFIDFVHPADKEATLEALSSLAKQEKIRGFVNRFRCIDGSYRWIEWRSFPSDKVIYAAARDITGRKRMEEALNASEAELRTLINTMTDIIFVGNSEGRYLKIVETNSSLLYRPSAELVGKTLHEVFPKDQADFFLNQIRQVLNTRKSVNFEYSLPIEYKTMWFYATISPMTEDRTLIVSRNITELKQAEAELKEQMNEINQYNKLMLGREDKMIELKKEINNLLEEEGKPKRYDV
ncbi:MAG: PAS domain S-box protein [bacterium]